MKKNKKQGKNKPKGYVRQRKVGDEIAKMFNTTQDKLDFDDWQGAFSVKTH